MLRTRIYSWVLAGALLLPGATYAATGSTNAGGDGLAFANPIKAKTINELVALLMKVVIDIGSIVAVFFVIWSGLKFVQARGNPEAIGEAKKTLLYTLIGIAILFGAQLIAALITTTVSNVTNVQ
jgi:hypothetical protein